MAGPPSTRSGSRPPRRQRARFLNLPAETGGRGFTLEYVYLRQTTEVSQPDSAGLVASLQALVTLFGLATAGKMNGKGLPNLLQLAVLIRCTMPATYIASPSPSSACCSAAWPGSARRPDTGPRTRSTVC